MALTIPSNAPFTGTQKSWLQGYLDGISSGFAPAAGNTATVAPEQTGLPVTIIWGSQTGNSEGLGKKLAKLLTKNGHTPTLKDMAEVTPVDLTGIAHLCVITSTYGDGEPPDNAAGLYAALLEDAAPSLDLLSFSVLALGDSSYPDFCKFGHDLDQRLAALGATRFAEIIECDVDFDDEFGTWSERITSVLKTA